MAGKRHCWNLRRGMDKRLYEDWHRKQEAKICERDRQLLAVMKQEEGKEERRRHIWQVKEKPRETQAESALLKGKDKINRRKQLEKKERIAKELEPQPCLKENSFKLRELELNLKYAALNKERAALLAEQEAMQFKTMKLEATERATEQAREALPGQTDEEERKSSSVGIMNHSTQPHFFS